MKEDKKGRSKEREIGKVEKGRKGKGNMIEGKVGNR